MAVSALTPTKTVQQLTPYIENSAPEQFLSSFFSVPAVGGIHNSDEIEFDSQVEDEVAAVPVDNSGSDYNMNDFSKFDREKVAPPVYKEGIQIPASKLGDIQAGQDIYQNVNFQSNGTALVGQSIQKLQNKVRRAMEIQAAQILTTGELAIESESGVTKYALDLGMPSTQFFNSSVAWSTTATADPIADIRAACALVPNPNKAIMDGPSFDAAMLVDSFKDNFKFPQAGTGLGVLRPGNPQSAFGTMYMGQLIVGGQRLDIWTYDEGVKPYPSATSKTAHIVKKCIVMNDSRRDATFGGIPSFINAAGAQRALNLPARITNRAQKLDVSVNSLIIRNESLFVGVGTRPLLIPRTKDGFAVISTQLA
jgi:hypothetical protein